MTDPLITATDMAEFRAMAESRMSLTGEFQYETGTTPDPETDTDVPVYATAFESMARVKAGARQVALREFGGRTSAESTRELHIPVSSADPWADPRSAQGVTFLVTEVSTLDDPTLLGARLTLSGPAPGSQTTARRLQITEVVT